MLGYPPGSLAGQPTEVIYVEPADRAWVTRLDEVGPRGKRVGQLKRRDGSLV
jgi:hypothetical protein